MLPEVLFKKEGRAGRVTLNRPEALHALNTNMCALITDALLSWIDDDEVDFILVDHIDGSRGFCAGGDVVMLANSGKSDSLAALTFFRTEYRLNDLISRYPKPYIAIMDGVTMGGGVGLSVHGAYQVATERTLFAMPETGIGLFPDVGGTWFLPRLRGELGTWLALTGARLKGGDVTAVGLATHFCATEAVPDLKRTLITHGVDALNGLKEAPECSFANQFSEIDDLFAGDCAAQIKGRLIKGSDWAKSQATKISAKSPLSTKIALRQMRTGRFLETLQDALKIEYRIASRLVKSRDFHEGVRAVLVDKDYCPNWNPSSIRSITFDRVSQYFTPLEACELSFLEI
ncbi:MAG: enoyl-CoA hydratase/isomerase family protein [Pseudomonadota bacterium]